MTDHTDLIADMRALVSAAKLGQKLDAVMPLSRKGGISADTTAGLVAIIEGAANRLEALSAQAAAAEKRAEKAEAEIARLKAPVGDSDRMISVLSDLVKNETKHGISPHVSLLLCEMRSFVERLSAQLVLAREEGERTGIEKATRVVECGLFDIALIRERPINADAAMQFCKEAVADVKVQIAERIRALAVSPAPAPAAVPVHAPDAFFGGAGPIGNMPIENVAGDAVVPSGWVMVPREPTREMSDTGKYIIKGNPGDAGLTERDIAETVYKGMLSAAPSPPAQEWVEKVREALTAALLPELRDHAGRGAERAR